MAFLLGAPAASYALLAAPTLGGPANGATGVSTTPTFGWTGVSGANRYWLMVATNQASLPTDPNAVSCPICVTSGLSGNTSSTNYTAPASFPNGGTTRTLEAGKTYYWQVQGWNTNGTQGSYSAVRSFTTALALLAAPTLGGPANGATGVSTTPMFSWTGVAGANRYWLMVATNQAQLPTDPNASSCPDCVMSGLSGNTTATNYTPPTSFPNGGTTRTLEAGKTYYWKVQAWNTNGTQGSYSAVRSFTTAPALLAAPTLGGPANGATGVSTNPTFSWTGVSGANRYWLMVATNQASLPTDPNASSCPDCVVSGLSGNTTATNYTPPTSFPNGGTTRTLEAGKTYYWKVQAWNTNGAQGSYSTVRSFTTAPALLAAPTLGGPANGATGVSTNPTFSWTGVAGANRYWLMVATNQASLPTDPNASSCPDCVMSGLSGNTTATNYTPPASFPNGGTTRTLEAGKTYYWKVQAWNTNGAQGSYSSVRSFTVGAEACDLAIQGAPIASPNPVTAGQVLAVGYTIRNNGPGGAGATQTKVQIKNSAGVQVAAATFSESALTAGASAARSRSVEIPASLSAGTYSAVVILDNQSALLQTTEANDYSSAVQFVVRAAQQSPDLANLVFQSLPVATVQTENNRRLLTVAARVRNSGASATGLFGVRFRLLDSGGTVGHSLSATYGPLAAGAETAISFSRLPLSDALSAGTYAAELTLDSGDAVAESNEADNVASGSVQLAAAQTAGGEPSWTLWNPALYFTKGRSKAVDTIVIHTTEGSYAGAIGWFKSPDNTGQTSAHYVISPQGEVTHMVALDNTAHHATYYNSRSVGIEVAGYASSAATWTPEVQTALKRLVGYLVTRFPVPVSHPAGDAQTYAKLLYDQPGIVGHSQIQPVNNPAYPYSLKSDPGPFFDWSIFMPAIVAENQAGTLDFAAASGVRALALASDAGSGLSLQLDLPAERIVCLESSPDLMSWSPESTFVAPGGIFAIELDPQDAVQKYYRLKWGFDRE